MSAISLLSYILIFLIFILNNIKNISNYVSSMLFYGIIGAYIALSIYFTDISSHSLFPVFISLFGVSYYTVLVGSRNAKGSVNLFVNTAQLLIPLFLVISSSLWEQIGLVALLEMVRIISDAGKTEKKTEQTFLNFINTSYKIMLLFVAFLGVYMLAGDIEGIGSVKIANYSILLPLSICLILIASFIGGTNSLSIERINLKNYSSKNLVAYNYIYQFLVPFILILDMKIILSSLEFNLYKDVVNILDLIFITLVIINIINLKRARDLTLKHHMSRNLIVLFYSYVFLMSRNISQYEYLLINTAIVILFNIKVLSLNYKVYFKNTVNKLINLILYLTPISPLFFYFVLESNKTNGINSTFVSLVGILIIVLLNYEMLSLKCNEKQKKVYKYNKFANQRLIYLMIGLIVNITAIYYEKI